MISFKPACLRQVEKVAIFHLQIRRQLTPCLFQTSLFFLMWSMRWQLWWWFLGGTELPLRPWLRSATKHQVRTWLLWPQERVKEMTEAKGSAFIPEVSQDNSVFMDFESLCYILSGNYSSNLLSMKPKYHCSGIPSRKQKCLWVVLRDAQIGADYFLQFPHN